MFLPAGPSLVRVRPNLPINRLPNTIGVLLRVLVGLIVTTEHPAKQNPEPAELRGGGTSVGVALRKLAPSGTGAVIKRPPRAGDHASR